MKRARSVAREVALNVMYQWDSAGVPFEEALETALQFVDFKSLGANAADRIDDARAYARELATGAKEHVHELDEYIAELAEGWPLERQPAVDRNILRIAIYEIKYVDSVPPVVAVDEAVELAKRFSTAESGKFVNGVLAGYLRRHQAKVEEEDIGSKGS